MRNYFIRIFTILLVITFWFEGSTLRWNSTDSISSYDGSHWIQFQLDHRVPPTINTEDIQSIEVNKSRVYIYTKSNMWALNYTQNVSGIDWSVEDPIPTRLLGIH